MTTDVYRGALSRAEIQAVWEGSVDRGYRDPLLRAGEGEGFEAWTQLFAVLERASRAIDVTTQAMFVLPWSGQTNPPAGGAARSEVDLSVSRTGRLHEPLRLVAGLVFVVEETVDFGPGGGVEVRTGRRYALAEDLYFPPGTKGPFVVRAVAELPGYGYDNPLPGTLSAFDQTAGQFENDLATTTISAQAAAIDGTKTRIFVRAANQPDMFVPEHVGQYFVATAGLNAGRSARIEAFDAPQPPLLGSGAYLEIAYSVGLSPVVGAFAAGERLEIKNGGTIVAYARAIDDRTVSGVRVLGFVLENGNQATAIAIGRTVEGLESGATGTFWNVGHLGSMQAEAPSGGVGGTAWRILTWDSDWGLSVTNEESPSGGRSAFLDELGNERALPRSPGESDEAYRGRVSTVADVVTPNAIKRALNRTLGSDAWCFREAGMEGLRGIFFDGGNELPSGTPGRGENDAYDEDQVYFTGLAGWSFDGSWAWDMGPAYFNGYDGNFGTVGSLNFQEPMVLEQAAGPLFWASGFFGRSLPAAPGLASIAFVFRSGRLPTTMSGFRLRGLYTGATFYPSSFVDHRQLARRYRVWLDYEQMRGFFLVTTRGIGSGEFGFAYDGAPEPWGYDLPEGFGVAYDGYGVAAAAMMRRAWQAVDVAHAGGVGFQFRRDDGSCP